MDRAIINVSIGSDTSWYHKGQTRLLKSLKKYEDDSFKYFIKKETPEYKTPYADKVMAIVDAYKKGYRYILYLDCSITALKPLDDIWKYIEENGYYLYESGYNCAQTSNDRSLSAFNLTRDQAETFYEAATNVVGIDTHTEKGKAFINYLENSVYNNAIYGLKWPNEEQRKLESQDERFQFHRQDQTVISLIAGILNFKLEKEGHFVSRYENREHTQNENVIFSLRGGDY